MSRCRQAAAGDLPECCSGELRRMDESGITRGHLKILFISGMGFFTDAYDLFVIGIVTSLLREQWHSSAALEGLAAAAALLASAVGALLFGRIADVIGRTRVYGYEVLVLGFGAIACALAPDMWTLLVFRFVLGLGIGGDYPVSSTLMSEYAGKNNRGLLVSLVFSMQAAGLVIGPLLATLLLWSGMRHELVWRLLLAFGALPALAVFRMRRSLAESPRFLLASGQHDGFHDGAAELLDAAPPGLTAPERSRLVLRGFWQGFGGFERRGKLLRSLFGASLAWAAMDFAYYGNTVSTPLVLQAINPGASALARILMQLALFVIAAVPGYLAAAVLLDRWGRKPIQLLGFAMMAGSFAVMSLLPGIDKLLLPFLIVYGISYFFTEFGPNTTTFVYPAELFPVQLRATGHGIAAAVGKIGGFAGVFLFPELMQRHGLHAAEAAAAAASLAGLAVTLWALPETRGRALEDIAAEPAAVG